MAGALRTIAGCVLAAGGALVLLAAPAQAGPPPVEIKVAKSKDGNYREQVKEKLAHDKHDFFFRVTNRSNTKRALDLQGSGQTFSHKARWFRGTENITDEVTSSTYDFNLRPGRRALFRMVVTRQTDNAECFFGQVNDPEHSGSQTAYAVLFTDSASAAC